jgi:DNA polymerase-3 subunit delta
MRKLKKEYSTAEAKGGTIHLITGDDNYQVSFQARQLINQFLAKDEKLMALESIDGEVNDASASVRIIHRICESITTGSLSPSGKKVVWLQNAVFLKNEKILKSPAFTEAFDDLYQLLSQGIPSTHMLIISAPSISEKISFRNVRGVEQHEFVIPTKPSQQVVYARQFIQKYITSFHNKKISQDAVERLLEIVGLNPAELASEMDKLIIFVGERNSIGVEDVNAVCSNTHLVKSWDLLDAIGERNLQKTLSIYRQCINQEESPIGIITMISNRLRELLLLREALNRKWLVLKKYSGYTIAEWTNIPPDVQAVFENTAEDPRTIHPYRLSKLTEQANRFSIAELKRAEFLTAETYEKLLSSGVSNELLIELLLIEIVPSSSAKTM